METLSIKITGYLLFMQTGSDCWSLAKLKNEGNEGRKTKEGGEWDRCWSLIKVKVKMLNAL